jgi:sigma-B regulation protein RsbU (phosphoserine phosphatase)
VEGLRGISVSLDLNETLQAILDGADSLFPFDAAAVYVVEPGTRDLAAKAERGYRNALPSAEPAKMRRTLDTVLRKGRSFTADVSAEPQYVERRSSTRAEIAVPILGSRRRALGALLLESDEEGTYVKTSSHLLELYASAIAGAIERALLHARILEMQRLDGELQLARRVMAGLLPGALPRIADFDVAASLEPQLAVGGDYYDVIPIDDERWGIVIADVVGKGIAAALLMSTLRASFQLLARGDLALRAVFRRANEFFRESAEEGRYATAFYGELDTATSRLAYINAGHPPPILVRRGGRAERLDVGGVPLGLFPEAAFVQGVVEMERGDVLGLFTDGITESVGRGEEMFGEEGVQRVLCRGRRRSARGLCAAVTSAVERFAKSPELHDDRTVVVLKRDPP